MRRPGRAASLWAGLLAGLALTGAAEPSAPAVCAEAGFDCAAWSSFHVEDSAIQRGPTLTFRQARLRRNDDWILLESVSNVGAGRAARLTARRLRLLDKLFEPIAIGHVGSLWRRSQVPPPLRAESLETPDGRPATLLFSSSRLAYGVADLKQARYRGVLSFLYCPASRTWLQAESFVPRAAFDRRKVVAEALAASCR